MNKGQRVFDAFKGGWGTVVDVNETLQWPVIVRFDKGITAMYLKDGRRFCDDAIPSLYTKQYLVTM